MTGSNGNKMEVSEIGMQIYVNLPHIVYAKVSRWGLYWVLFYVLHLLQVELPRSCFLAMCLLQKSV